MKVFAEATLGNTVDNSKRAGFIKYDRNVLRFQAVWDDRESLYGDIQRFEVGMRIRRNGCVFLLVHSTLLTLIVVCVSFDSGAVSDAFNVVSG